MDFELFMLPIEILMDALVRTLSARQKQQAQNTVEKLSEGAELKLTIMRVNRRWMFFNITYRESQS